MEPERNISYKPPAGTGENVEIGGSAKESSQLPGKTLGETEQKTCEVAENAGIFNKTGESPSKVITPQSNGLAATTGLSSTIESEEAAAAVRESIAEDKPSPSDLQLVAEPFDPDDASQSDTDSISEQAADPGEIDQTTSDTPMHQNEGGAKTQLDIDHVIHEAWLDSIKEFLDDSEPEKIREKVVSVRRKISEVKEQFEISSSEAHKIERKIQKAKNYIDHKMGSVKGMRGSSGKSGGRTRRRRQQAFLLIKETENRMSELKASRSSFAPDIQFHSRVHSLMKNGSLKPVPGGKSGVYFLCDAKGDRKFVVKPYDEDMLTLNNPKGFATPYHDADGMCRPKGGIPMFSATKNEAMASAIARELGISRSTAKAQMMILTSDTFHDITDDIDADPEKIAETYGLADKEKLCVVQEYISDCREVGDLLLEGSGKDQFAFMRMDHEARTALEREILPKDIDQEMFEEGIILALVCGEADGNAGNFLLSNKPDPQTHKRAVYKIDNAAAFTENNSSINTGVLWLLECSEKPISNKARQMINNLDPDRIASLMKEQGYSDLSISEMQERIYMMKVCLDYLGENTTIGDWATLVEDQFVVYEEQEEEAVAEQPVVSPLVLEIQGEIAKLEEKISKQESHIKHLESQVSQKPGGGKRKRSRQQSARQQIDIARETITSHQEAIASLQTKLEEAQRSSNEPLVDQETVRIQKAIGEIDKKIEKQRGHIKHLEGMIPKKTGGKRSRSKKQSLTLQIKVSELKIADLEQQKAKLELELS